MVETRSNAASLLELHDVEVMYGGSMLALRGVSLDVGEGSVVALLGANGAGKTTTVRAITNLLSAHAGRVTKGSITLAGRRIDGLDAAATVRLGVAQVMEGRRIFAELTVRENLIAGGFTRDRSEAHASYERVLNLFPTLAQRSGAVAGYLSGGEQQMLAIGRALMQSPRLLLLDEPSLGLAPIVVGQVRDIISEVAAQGVSVLLIEQNAMMALSTARYGYVLENGRVVKSGASAELLADRDMQQFYLGIGEAGRVSYRDAATNRRRAART
jgi:branched-chain amino acid transport system ATP-binding protein